MNVLISSLIAGLLTGVGSLLSISIKRPTPKIVGFILGFAAGIMLGISFFMLIPESLDINLKAYTFIGLLTGIILMFAFEKIVHHKHSDNDKHNYLKMGYFIAFGIAVHNFPEGVAIGATSAISEKTSLFMALLIGLHNIVEGVAVSLPLHLGNIKKSKTVLITTLTGLSTMVGAYIGIKITLVSDLFISLSLAFAAGAMIYISLVELIPNSFKENKKTALIAILLGLLTSVLI